ncbi:MAG: septum formation protein Maf, partial [Chloroflexi bacterium]|nr:septum formation protein Maf [Chloroflexota bacterium]
MHDERVEPGRPRLVLASASPRRQALLARLGLPFEVVPSGSDEDVAPALAPELVVRQLAQRKAALVTAGRPAAVVIGCDTIVVLDGAQIGKPVDAVDAVATLRRLRGRSHWVYTGVAVVDAGRGLTLLSALRTRVVMVDVDDATIAAYVATGEPMDKAGS